MYCLNMLTIALELAREDAAYEDVATKFFEHFLYIAQAMNTAATRRSLWDEEDGVLLRRAARATADEQLPLRVRSMVGLIPLFAVETHRAGDLSTSFPASRGGWSGSSTTGPT